LSAFSGDARPQIQGFSTRTTRRPRRSREPDAVLLSKGPYRDFIERFGEGLRQETIAFIEVMRGERENPSPPASAMEALRAAVACEVSREEGRAVRLSEIADDSTGSS
jgi:myo-inositol 2-dehydrogenase / D-chiro-inositol 1-dehydrogenase